MKKKISKNALQLQLSLNMMMLPGMVILFLFSFLPMFGIIMAFQKYYPALGFFKSKWVGLANFTYIMHMSDFPQALVNSLIIASMKIVASLVVCITFSLLLNEVENSIYKRGVQTIVYFPHFLSWVLLGGILVDILSPEKGIVNSLIQALGGQKIFFLGDNNWFRYILVITDTWKEFGFGAVIYLAAISGIDPTLYEAAIIDGAGRFKQAMHITLPGMRNIIVLSCVLSIGGVLNAGFDQIFNLYSPVVYQTGDIIDTLVYRIGLVNEQYSVGTAVGLFQSIVAILLISVSYRAAYKTTGYRVL